MKDKCEGCEVCTCEQGDINHCNTQVEDTEDTTTNDEEAYGQD